MKNGLWPYFLFWRKSIQCSAPRTISTFMFRVTLIFDLLTSLLNCSKLLTKTRFREIFVIRSPTLQDVSFSVDKHTTTKSGAKMRDTTITTKQRDHSIRHRPFPICFFRQFFGKFSHNACVTDDRQTDEQNTVV